MITFLINLGILVIVILALWYILSKAPIPEGARPMVQIVGVVLVAIGCIWFLLQLPRVLN